MEQQLAPLYMLSGPRQCLLQTVSDLEKGYKAEDRKSSQTGAVKPRSSMLLPADTEKQHFKMKDC